MFEILKSITHRIVQEIGGFPDSGKYTFSVESEDIDGQNIEFFESSFTFSLNNQKFDAFNTSSEFVSDQHFLFEKLRNEMALKHENNTKWLQAEMIFGEDKKVKTHYKYPDT
jgi:hypothetical protein